MAQPAKTKQQLKKQRKREQQKLAKASVAQAAHDDGSSPDEDSD